MQLAPPAVTPYAPQPSQSQYLAQALASMSAPPPRTAVAAGANAVAGMLNKINDPSNPPQWKNPMNGAPSIDWMNSPIGKTVGGMFGLGQAAQGLNNASGAIATGGAMPMGL